jgi:hypothetical protein
MGRQADAQKVWSDAMRSQPKNDVLQETIKRLAPAALQSMQ